MPWRNTLQINPDMDAKKIYTTSRCLKEIRDSEYRLNKKTGLRVRWFFAKKCRSPFQILFMFYS